jgi:hypothetical protein
MDPLDQILAALVVHHEADRAQLHSVHRLVEAGMAMQGLQHEAIAAQRTSTSAFRADGPVHVHHLRGALRLWAGLARKAGVAVIGGSVAM